MLIHSALPVDPQSGMLRPLPLDRVILDSAGFWGRRAAVNADATFDHNIHWLERAGWLGNFDLAAAGSGTLRKAAGVVSSPILRSIKHLKGCAGTRGTQ